MVQRHRGQCYDGASAMSGKKNGLSTLVREEEPRALYTHCYGHALNLAAQDALRRNKVMNDALDISIEVIKLVKVRNEINTIDNFYVNICRGHLVEILHCNKLYS